MMITVRHWALLMDQAKIEKCCFVTYSLGPGKNFCAACTTLTLANSFVSVLSVRETGSSGNESWSVIKVMECILLCV